MFRWWVQKENYTDFCLYLCHITHLSGYISSDTFPLTSTSLIEMRRNRAAAVQLLIAVKGFILASGTAGAEEQQWHGASSAGWNALRRGFRSRADQSAILANAQEPNRRQMADDAADWCRLRRAGIIWGTTGYKPDNPAYIRREIIEELNPMWP